MWFPQSIEVGHQRQKAEGRQQCIGVEKPGVANEKWVEGQQADRDERHAPVEEARQQRIEDDQTQRGDQRDGDAAPGEKKRQVAESLPVLRGQPGEAANPAQVGDACGRVEEAADSHAQCTQPHRRHPRVARGGDRRPVAGRQRVGEADGAVDPGWFVGGHVTAKGGQAQ